MNRAPHLNLLERLASSENELRPSERKVARTVLDDPTSVLHSSMAALANRAGVSEPTIMRFCTAMGFDGYQLFKLALAETLAIGVPLTHSAIDARDSVETMAMKIFDHSISSLDRARRALDTQAIAAAVDALLNAGDVLFVGFGASDIVAQDAVQKTVLVGVPCAAPIDHHQQFMSASMTSSDSVVVAISNTGRTRPVIEIANQAKANGATVIAIVGAPSPLTELAAISLVVPTFEDTDIHTPMVSRLAALVLIDVLATAIAVRRGPGHLERLRRMKEALSAFRGSLDSDAVSQNEDGGGG